MQVAGTSGTGNAANNRIRGSDGSDTIDGGAGNDRIIGGGGADELTGGVGRDTFLFGAFADSAPTDSDLITDFTRGQDRMDVRAIDAFAFVGTGGFAGGGQASIRYEFAGSETLVQFDAGDGGAAEMVVRLTGNIALTGSDFLL
jgi:Ca2+-binding RTX toxin-like protein